VSEQRRILGTKSVVSENLERRRHKQRLVRLAVWGVVLVAIAIAAALIVSGRTVVPVVSKQLYPIKYGTTIGQVASRYGLDPYMVAAVAKTESGYNPNAVSPDGAVGLMQLMPDTADWITGLSDYRGGHNPDLTKPADSLELGACYLGYLVKKYDGATKPALAAYNAGQSTVDGWVASAGGADSFETENIPYAETRGFVEKVENYWKLYIRIYPGAFGGAGAQN
jgi:soluble lytic murein transglycosylase